EVVRVVLCVLDRGLGGTALLHRVLVRSAEAWASIRVLVRKLRACGHAYTSSATGSGSTSVASLSNAGLASSRRASTTWSKRYGSWRKASLKLVSTDPRTR